jgi:hypothetical protein
LEGFVSDLQGKQGFRMTQESFDSRISKRLSSLNHVGCVKHYEGLKIERFIELVHSALNELGMQFEDMLETPQKVYNCLAPQAELLLWFRAQEVEMGVVCETKVIHTTEWSAFADELLSNTIETLERLIYQK